MDGAILYKNLLRNSGVTILAEDTILNYGFSNALDGRTATQAGFENGSSRVVDIDFGETTTIDSLAFARHNLGSVSATLWLYGSDDNFTNTSLLTAISASNDNVYVKTGINASYRYYRIHITPSAGNAYISDLFLGQALNLERSQKHGFTKPEHSDGDTVISNVTRGQNLAGIDINQGPRRVKFNLFYYSEGFFTQWAEVVEHLKLNPIYVLWSEGEQPFYCWPYKLMPQPATTKSINGYYNVKLDMLGFIE